MPKELNPSAAWAECLGASWAAFPGIGRVWGWHLWALQRLPEPWSPPALITRTAQPPQLLPLFCQWFFRKWTEFFTLLKIQTPLLKKLSMDILYILFHIFSILFHLFYILFHIFPKFEGRFRVLFSEDCHKVKTLKAFLVLFFFLWNTVSTLHLNLCSDSKLESGNLTEAKSSLSRHAPTLCSTILRINT